MWDGRESRATCFPESGRHGHEICMKSRGFFELRCPFERHDIFIYPMAKKEDAPMSSLSTAHALVSKPIEKTFFIAFMVQDFNKKGDDLIPIDDYGQMPPDNIFAVFRPMKNRDRSPLIWEKMSPRFCTDTYELLLLRLLDCWDTAHLVEWSGKEFVISRPSSLTRYNRRELTPGSIRAHYNSASEKLHRIKQASRENSFDDMVRLRAASAGR